LDSLDALQQEYHSCFFGDILLQMAASTKAVKTRVGCKKIKLTGAIILVQSNMIAEKSPAFP